MSRSSTRHRCASFELLVHFHSGSGRAGLPGRQSRSRLRIPFPVLCLVRHLRKPEAAGLQGPIRDTGWRDLTPMITMTVAAGRLLYRRQNDRVVILLDGLQVSSSGTTSFPRLGTGVRPSFLYRDVWFYGTTELPAGTLRISETGYFNLYGVTPDRVINARLEFDTREAMPSPIPGSPIT